MCDCTNCNLAYNFNALLNDITGCLSYYSDSFCRVIGCVSCYFAHGSGGGVVMTTSVCVSVSVCLSARISPKPHARYLPTSYACCLWRDSVLLRRGDETPRGRGNFGVSFHIDNALYSREFGMYTKRLNRSRCRLGRWFGLAKEPCLR